MGVRAEAYCYLGIHYEVYHDQQIGCSFGLVGRGTNPAAGSGAIVVN